MTIKHHPRLPAKAAYAGATAAMVSGLFFNLSARAQLTPGQIDEASSVIAGRIEAATILAGDYGIGGGNFYNNASGSDNVDFTLDKFGGSGDIGDPMPIGNTGIAWQPRLQGSMGTLHSTDNYQGDALNAGDESKLDTFAIQFGGGGRFWFNDAFSIAPTIMGMYGTSKESYFAHSTYGLANQPQAQQLGLINWTADTWTVRPAVNLQYIYRWKRTLVTLSSDFTYFYTESFNDFSPSIKVSGGSETWVSKIDVDVPLGISLFGQELRTGGYYSWTQLYDGVQEGLNTDGYNEIHARVVLDFLGQLWKVQWIGIGYSHYWNGDFSGDSVGLDAAFRF